MTEPKFKLGQSVIFLKGGLIEKGKITAVAELFHQRNHKGYQYNFGHSSFADDLSGDEWVWEEHVFSSRQELLDSL